MQRFLCSELCLQTCPLLILKTPGEPTLLSPLHSQPGKPRHEACLGLLNPKVAEPRVQPHSHYIVRIAGKDSGQGSRPELPEWRLDTDLYTMQASSFISGFGSFISSALCVSQNLYERKLCLEGGVELAPTTCLAAHGDLPSGLRSFG